MNVQELINTASAQVADDIQQPALEMWRGNEANVLKAQQALYHGARCNQAARRGEYSAAMEGASA